MGGLEILVAASAGRLWRLRGPWAIQRVRHGQHGGLKNEVGEGPVTEALQDFQAGLRCHDVHVGLRNVDPNSATAAPLADTRMVGMAASLASTIRGQERRQ